MDKQTTHASDISTYIESYDTLTTIIIIFLIFIPIIVLIALSTSVIVKNSVETQNLVRGSDNNLDGVPANLSQKCKNYVRWVYSNRNIDPRYGLCDVKTIKDAYRWVVCKKPDGCPDADDPSIDCSQLYCR